jgi:hypothetical protein
MRFLLFGLALTLVGLLLDVYVYRRWRRFVREAGWPEFGYRLYAVLIPLAALLMPLYILLWRFWEVEPRLPRAILSGLWVLWYLPKLFLAPVLLLAQGASLLDRLRRRSLSASLDSGPEARRHFLRTAGWALAGVPFVLTGRGLIRDTYAVTLFRETVYLPTLPRAFDGLRIVQLSDLHAGSYLNPSCYLSPGSEKIVAAMLSRLIAAFCIIDDALQAMGHTDHPQAKTPASAILTLALLAALEFGGKHNKALAFAKDLGLFTHVPSPSRFNRRLHALYPLLLPLLHLLAQVWKNLYQAQAYALDTFPLPACENIRAPRSRLFPDKAYRGFIPSKRVYFHGLKLHLLVDDGKFVHEVNLTPGSFHDLASLLLLPLDLPEGAELYLDRGYESHLYEDLLREAQEVVPMVIRRRNSRRYLPWMQYLAIVGRRVVETVGSMLHHLFPRRIHAVTQEGFVIKVLTFVLAHNISLLTQKMAG